MALTRKESHLFYADRKAFVYDIQSSCLFQLRSPGDLIWQSCLAHTKAEITECLMSNGCSATEVSDAWSELESNGLISTDQFAISIPVAPPLTAITSLHVQIHDRRTGKSLEQETAAKMLTWLANQTSPGQPLFLVLDLREVTSSQLVQDKTVKSILDWIRHAPSRISCAVQLDACQLTESLNSFMIDNEIDPTLLMGSFFRAKQHKPVIYSRAIDLILALHEHRRSVAYLSLSHAPTAYELEKELGEIRQLGFKAFYTHPITGLLPSAARDWKSSAYLAWVQPYLKAIQEAVRPYFVFANAILQQRPVKRWYQCQAGITHLAVSAAGELYPCSQFVGGKIGAIGNVEDLEANRPARTTFIKRHVDHNVICIGCWARYRCGGDCAYYTSQSDGKPAGRQNLVCDFVRWSFEQFLARASVRNPASDILIKLWYGTLLPHMPHLADPLPDSQQPDPVNFRAWGNSMSPTINEGDQIQVSYLHPEDAQTGDIILFERDNTIIAHRLLRKLNRGGRVIFVEKGDFIDRPFTVAAERIFAKVVAIHRRDSK